METIHWIEGSQILYICMSINKKVFQVSVFSKTFESDGVLDMHLNPTKIITFKYEKLVLSKTPVQVPVTGVRTEDLCTRTLRLSACPKCDYVTLVMCLARRGNRSHFQSHCITHMIDKGSLNKKLNVKVLNTIVDAKLYFR